MDEANSEFDRVSEFAADESQSNGSRGVLNTRYEKHYEGFYAANNLRVMEVCKKLKGCKMSEG